MSAAMLRLLPFLILIPAILFGGHYFLYRSIASFFNLAGGKIKVSLFAALFALPLIFLAVFSLSHFIHSAAVNLLYVLAVSWLAVFVNLLMAAGVIWTFSSLIKLTGINFNILVFSAGIFSIAIIFSAHGFWNAFHPQIKNIDVSIKNLPTQWQGKTMIQLSDVHLGQVHNPAFMQMVADKVNTQNPDLILITGDLFDGMDGNLDNFIGPLNSLRAKRGIFFVTGNHETYLGIDEVLRVLSQTGIRVLNNEKIDLDGLQIVGLAYPGADDSAGFLGNIKNESALINSLNIDKSRPSILMYHAPANIDQAQAGGIDLQLSGHAHRGQIWPFGVFTWLAYGQYHYGLNTAHTLGDISVYTSAGVGTWGPPMRTGNTPEIPVFRLK